MLNVSFSLVRLGAAGVALSLSVPVWAHTALAGTATTLPPIVTTAAPPQQTLTFTTNPKQPRQPLPASDGADYLKTIPGFSALGSGGTNGDPVLRGMMGSRINILTQDSAMPGACPARMDAPTSYISPQNFDELVVIKGPQTVLWGPGASAGTVRFNRHAPRFGDNALLFDGILTGGSWGRHDQAVDLAIGNDTAYARITANHARAQDYEDGDGNSVPSAWKKWNTDLSLGWTPDADTLVELSAGAGDGHARYAGRGMDGVKFKRESLSLRAQKDHVSPRLTRLEAQVAYHYADHLMDNHSLRTPTMVMPDANVDRATWSARLAGTLALSDQVQLVLGTDMQDSTHRARNGDALHPYRDQPWIKDARMRNLGVFSELTWQADTQSRWISGLRLDRASVKDFRATLEGGHDHGHGGGHGAGHGHGHGHGHAAPNPTANQTRRAWLPSGFIRYEHSLANSPVSWYAGLGHVQRFPDYWELFSPGAGPDGSINAFVGVQPEKTTQLDLGLQIDTNTLQVWINAYVGRVQDFILFDDRHHTNQGRNVNAHIMGGELGVNWQPVRHWSTQASLAYAWGRNTTDKRALPQMPPLELRLGATYDNGTWSAGALWRVVAAQNRVTPDTGNVVGKDFGPSAGFGTLSLHAAYTVNPRLRLSVGVDNVLNKTYSEHLNKLGNAGFGYSGTHRYNNPGRTLWATANLQF